MNKVSTSTSILAPQLIHNEKLSNNNFEYLLKFNQKHLLILDDVIHKNLHTQVQLIDQMIHYIIQAGGKRLRPLILIYIGLALLDSKEQLQIHAISEQDNNKLKQLIYILAAAIEFIHTATLLHDDVVDESSLRRGKATAHSLFGNAPAVLVGDFLYSRAFEMMVSADNLNILKILAKTTNTIAEGEVDQLIHIGNLNINLTTYFTIIENKTAKLFESAAEIATVLVASIYPINNTMLELYTSSLKKYGRYLGCAFQLIDDYLDYAGNTTEMGKAIGDDLKQGKLTLPLIYLLEHGSSEHKQLIKTSIEKIISNTSTQQDIECIINIVKNSAALEYTKQQAIQQAAQAQACLYCLNEKSVYTEVLYALCDLAIYRIK
jgi:octaprenyl-diphosphate synthase